MTSNKTLFKYARFCMILCLAFSLQACATKAGTDSNGYQNANTIPDPIEPFNRAMLKLNTGLDIFIIEPIASSYEYILPQVVRDSVQNFMRNLRTPLYVANNALQGDFGDAGVGTARFVINSTFGLVGLFDVAEKRGLGFEQEDFGQTLATWGVGDGFYVVWPVFGPSSLRDTVGMVADSVADPVRIVAFSENEDWVYYTRNGVEALDNRARLLDTIRDLRKNSLDYYSSLKSIYEQRRVALIRDNVYTNNYDIPNYDYDEFE